MAHLRLLFVLLVSKVVLLAARDTDVESFSDLSQCIRSTFDLSPSTTLAAAALRSAGCLGGDHTMVQDGKGFHAADVWFHEASQLGSAFSANGDESHSDDGEMSRLSFEAKGPEASPALLSILQECAAECAARVPDAWRSFFTLLNRTAVQPTAISAVLASYANDSAGLGGQREWHIGCYCFPGEFAPPVASAINDEDDARAAVQVCAGPMDAAVSNVEIPRRGNASVLAVELRCTPRPRSDECQSGCVATDGAGSCCRPFGNGSGEEEGHGMGSDDDNGGESGENRVVVIIRYVFIGISVLVVAELAVYFYRKRDRIQQLAWSRGMTSSGAPGDGRRQPDTELGPWRQSREQRAFGRLRDEDEAASLSAALMLGIRIEKGGASHRTLHAGGILHNNTDGPSHGQDRRSGGSGHGESSSPPEPGGSSSSSSCAICLDVFGDVCVEKLPCGHLLHEHCLRELLTFNLRHFLDLLCPLCGASMLDHPDDAHPPSSPPLLVAP